MEYKTFRLIKKFLILITFLISVQFAFATSHENSSTCYHLADSEDNLVRQIMDGDETFQRKVIGCMQTSETQAQLLDVTESIDLNQNPTITNLLSSFNGQKDCFYFNVANQANYEIRPLPVPYNIYIQSDLGLMPLDIIKDIDAKGNLNCQIDTPSEKCKLKLAKERITNPVLLNSKQQTELYNCYGNEETPRNLNADPNQLSGKDSFNVFDEETGLIANQQQKNTLEKLSNNKAGPVIGFINMIINYLASIVFVLCMASLIYGGYNLIFAGFDTDMQEKGKNAVKYAITGFFLIMLSYTIVILVQSIF